jgi:hypothetical protein
VHRPAPLFVQVVTVLADSWSTAVRQRPWRLVIRIEHVADAVRRPFYNDTLYAALFDPTLDLQPVRRDLHLRRD